MSKQNGRLSSEQLSQVVVKGMKEMKAEDVVVMDLRKVNNAVADFFVLGSGNSVTHIDSIAESVDAEVNKVSGENPWHREGFSNKTWVLLDYVDVVAHVFNRDTRDFYALENLWGDAKIVRHNEVENV